MNTLLKSDAFDAWLVALQDRRGVRLYWLLLGGDKSSQTRDIARAIKMALHLKEEL